MRLVQLKGTVALHEWHGTQTLQFGRHFCRSHQFDHWQFRANVRPDAKDMASAYRITRESLARRLFPSIAESSLSRPPRLSPLHLEKGAFFKFEFVTRFLEASNGT